MRHEYNFEYGTVFMVFLDSGPKIVRNYYYKVGRISCSLYLKGNERHIDTEKKEKIHILLVSGLKIDFKIESRNNILRNQKEIYKIILKVLNVVLVTLRNYAGIHELHEETLNEQNISRELARFKVNKKINGRWVPVVTNRLTLVDLLAHQYQNRRTITNGQIKIAFTNIKEQKSITIEQSLLVNSHEYLELGNYKLATIEIVTALEVSFANFARKYLLNTLGFTKEEINTIILNGIFSNINSFIRSLPESNGINFNKVNKLIRRRNILLHQGTLKSIKKEEFQSLFWECYTLCLFLKNKVSK